MLARLFARMHAPGGCFLLGSFGNTVTYINIRGYYLGILPKRNQIFEAFRAPCNVLPSN